MYLPAIDQIYSNSSLNTSAIYWSSLFPDIMLYRYQSMLNFVYCVSDVKEDILENDKEQI